MINLPSKDRSHDHEIIKHSSQSPGSYQHWRVHLNWPDLKSYCVTRVNKYTSRERQNKWKGTCPIKLLFRDTIKVDVIERDPLQHWPEVSAHSFTGDKRAEPRVETAVGLFFWPTSVTQHPLFETHPLLKHWLSSPLIPGMLLSYAGLSSAMYRRVSLYRHVKCAVSGSLIVYTYITHGLKYFRRIWRRAGGGGGGGTTLITYNDTIHPCCLVMENLTCGRHQFY